MLVDDDGRPWPPTYEVVRAAGYSHEAALRIVAEEQEKAARGEVPPNVAETREAAEEKADRLREQARRALVGRIKHVTDKARRGFGPEEDTVKFHSITDNLPEDDRRRGKPIEFTLGDRRYTVPAGGEFDVLAPLVGPLKRRGLLIAEGANPRATKETPAAAAKVVQLHVAPAPPPPPERDEGEDHEDADGDDDPDAEADEEGAGDPPPARVARAVESLRAPSKRKRASAEE